MAEFKTLRGKMDAFQPQARTVQEYMGGTANWRTDLYSGPTSGTLMTHQDSIALFKKLGVKMTPELKSASVAMPFDGFTQEAYAQKMLDEYKAANVPPSQVFAQSFNKNDILYWIKAEPAFGKQAVFLDGAEKLSDLPDLEKLIRPTRRRASRSLRPPSLRYWMPRTASWWHPATPRTPNRRA